MIIDNIINRHLYKGEILEYCLNYLADYKGLPIGRIELKEGVFVLVQEYQAKTISQGKLEAHQNYVDIQYIVKGAEQIGYCARKNPKVLLPYNPDKDVEFYIPHDSEGGTGLVMLSLNEGDFAVFYPDDLHMPGIGDDKVNKLVIKIPLSLLK